MTLEDFFTLTEMKDGLAAPCRVQELVALMQMEKDYVVKNFSDVSRQWAAVASTIAATDNKDCLDLFIQLDGLWFIDRWLKDAHKLSTDTSDGFIEESITALLRALEKLQIDKERSISSGIWITVNKLIDHCSSRVRDSARALFDSWKKGKIMDVANHDLQNVVSFHDVNDESGREECVTADIPLSKGVNVENNVAEPAVDDTLHSRSLNCVQPEGVDVKTETNNDEVHSQKSLDYVNFSNKSADVLTSVSSNSGQERPALGGKSSMVTVEGRDATECHICPGSDGNIAEQGSDVLRKFGSVADKSGMIASANSKVEPGAISSSTDGTSAPERINESAVQNIVESIGGKVGLNVVALHGMTTAVLAIKVRMNGEGSTTDHSDKEALNNKAKDVEKPTNTARECSGNDSKVEKPKDLWTPFSHVKNVGATDDDREDSSDGSEDMRGGSDLSKPSAGTRSPDFPERTKSDIELEYGIVDALEVARQVAQEVEKEVEDFRERSCSSSSENNVETYSRQPESPDSLNGKEAPSPQGPTEDEQVRQNQSNGPQPAEAGKSKTLDTLENEAEKGMHKPGSSQVTEVAIEPEVNAEKGLCEFDLNQDLCSDDMDHPVNPVMAPISIVSASRLAVTSGSPSAPLQFEGAFGWKGSAATSAFRPASPRKIPDGDKTFVTGGSSGSNQRRNWLDIDLNVAEGGDEKVSDLLSVRQIPLSSSLHSGESSLDVDPRRSERPNLDLNRISDDVDALVSDLRMGGQVFYPRNRQRSPSPASSSSMQPLLRNFNLNDRPLYQNDFPDQGPYHVKSSQTASPYDGPRPGDPAISIMGTKVEVSGRMGVDGKEYVAPSLSLSTGKLPDPAIDTNLTRMGGVLGMIPPGSYAHSPLFGYTGLPTAPSMPISSAMYGAVGPIPYMVDSRGAPVVPQIVGSAPAVPPSFSQPPFIMSMTGAPIGLNGAGPPRPNFDLNSGFAIEGGSSGSLRQLFMPGQARPVEEHLRANSQPASSSGVGAKRKQPESGWEPYSLQYKHTQALWR
ncbi:hypothetical protein Tsubulata_046947 [Turnera subulata]|uniref:TFIIS N-terminal domain-containing protein n=1 Tax=Turnera subulata TaxID=218843 RepID=A0A9Q0JFA3_9ROSI|nr:hypothetical protein Tsubulata_046947 [Turnera subulata]